MLSDLTLINTLGNEEARRRLNGHLFDAERHLSAALGEQGHTRRFVAGLFAHTHDGVRLHGAGTHPHAAGARASLARH